MLNITSENFDRLIYLAKTLSKFNRKTYVLKISCNRFEQKLISKLPHAVAAEEAFKQIS